MAQRLFRTFVLVMLTIAALGPSPSQADDQDKLRPTIAFVSTRDHLDLTGKDQFKAGEIYLMNPTADPTQQDLRRLTDNLVGDGFAKLSPDGKKIVFDSNRLAIENGEVINTSDLFLMNTDGTKVQYLTRGSNASWAPDSKHIAFHASASGDGQPLRADPGSVTEDSDIFIVKVGECLEDAEACQDPKGPIKRNLTNSNTDAGCEDDAEWSADGKKIVFTSHPCTEYTKKSFSAEIYVINPDGTGRDPLTHDTVEERAPAWSPKGDRIVFMCKPNPALRFELCVMDADGNSRTQLTTDDVLHDVFQASPQWLTNTEITFDVTNHNADPLDPMRKQKQLWAMKLDDISPEHWTQLTDALGINAFASPGVVRIPGPGQDPVAAGSTDRSAETVQGPAVDDGKAEHGKQDKDKNDNKHKQDNKDNQHKKDKGGSKRHR